ncbi:MAG: hypothetical protein DYH08_14245 [Actinobacteria bacterium ATB1]|nr:hypothetical protein [Actinobacteria bacterium ATB1]
MKKSRSEDPNAHPVDIVQRAVQDPNTTVKTVDAAPPAEMAAARHDPVEARPVADPPGRRGRHDVPGSDLRWGFELGGPTGICVVLVHDLGTTPVGLDEVARSVHEVDVSVRVPVLPGHEDFARPRNLKSLNPPELLAAVDEAVGAASRDFEYVTLAGFGLGGSLALAVTAELARTDDPRRRGPDALALVSTPYAAFRRRLPLAWLSRAAVNSAPGPAPDCKKPSGDEIRLEAWPGELADLPADVERLGREAAGEVTVPVICFHAREDHVVPAADARRLVRSLGSPASELVWLERSFHQAWIDYDARLVGERIARLAMAIDNRQITGQITGQIAGNVPGITAPS